jgi:hypothetical protein
VSLNQLQDMLGLLNASGNSSVTFGHTTVLLVEHEEMTSILLNDNDVEVSVNYDGTLVIGVVERPSGPPPPPSSTPAPHAELVTGAATVAATAVAAAAAATATTAAAAATTNAAAATSAAATRRTFTRRLRYKCREFLPTDC